MTLKDLTLITCSYNTPQFTKTMLKSFVYHHELDDKFNVIVMENSTNDDTRLFLEDNDIKYDLGPGRTHSISVDLALTKVKTDYALLVDTDIVFNKPIYDIYKEFKESDASLLGEVCANRSGFKLHPRVVPWFCFINVKKINEHNIRFHDQNRIDSTNSNSFYKNVPLNMDKSGHYYDVGSTFFEDVIKSGLKVEDKNFDPEYFCHFEGASWYMETNDYFYLDLYLTKKPAFQIFDIHYSPVSLKAKFL